MQRLMPALYVTVLCLTLSAQKMVKVDILAIAGSVPGPPVSVEAAYSRMDCGEGSIQQNCTARQ